MYSETTQCNLWKKTEKLTRALNIHQRSCKNNLLNDKNRLLDEVSQANTIVTEATENNTNKISKHYLKAIKTL